MISHLSWYIPGRLVRLVFTVNLYITLVGPSTQIPAKNTRCIIAPWTEVHSIAAVMKPDEALLIKTRRLVENMRHRTIAQPVIERLF